MTEPSIERMRPGRLRRLTRGELRLADEVFGPELDAMAVRVFAWPLPWPRRAFVPGRVMGWDLIVYPKLQARTDFASATLGVQAVFVHELTHCWQAQRGVVLPWAKLRAGDAPSSYAYDLEAAAFDRLNIEQQAMAVEHAFRLRRGGRAPHAAAVYAAALPFTGSARV